jgi:alkaline phosphatase
MKRTSLAAAIAGSVLLILAGTQAAGAGPEPDGGHGRDPRNVIYLIGDGMGIQEITAARYYLGVRKQAQRRPDAVHRLRHHVVGQALCRANTRA